MIQSRSTYKQPPQKHRCNLTKEELRKLDELRPYWKTPEKKVEVKQERKPIRHIVHKTRSYQPSLF